MDSICRREANSGTTPPYFPWISCCDEIILERIAPFSLITEAAVSSQDVSIPSRNEREDCGGFMFALLECPVWP